LLFKGLLSNHGSANEQLNRIGCPISGSGKIRMRWSSLERIDEMLDRLIVTRSPFDPGSWHMSCTELGRMGFLLRRVNDLVPPTEAGTPMLTFASPTPSRHHRLILPIHRQLGDPPLSTRNPSGTGPTGPVSLFTLSLPPSFARSRGRAREARRQERRAGLVDRIP